jgi:hypothetical protein
MQTPEHRWEKATGYRAQVSKGFSALKPNAYTASATDDVKCEALPKSFAPPNRCPWARFEIPRLIGVRARIVF